MFDGLTIFERIILESLERKEKNFTGLLEDTALNEKLMQRSLQNLISKNIILISQNTYCLNKAGRDSWKEFILKDENISLELQELLEGMLKVALKRNPDGFMKIKKLNLEEKDENILKAMMKNVETFLLELEKKQKKESKTAHKKVVITGLASYQDIIQNI